jgi:histidinol dehydrogenase
VARDAGKLSRGIVTAGAIFLGPWSPTVLGDYVAGPSHTLPTGGAGASFAGLTVDQFQRRTSVVEYSRASLKKALPAVMKFAELEGLDAHGKSADIRIASK